MSPLPRMFQTRYFAGKVPYIRCALCERVAQHVVCERVDVGNERVDDVFRVTISCHGSTESFEVEARVVEAAHEVTIGRAFESEAARLLGKGDE